MKSSESVIQKPKLPRVLNILNVLKLEPNISRLVWQFQKVLLSTWVLLEVPKKSQVIFVLDPIFFFAHLLSQPNRQQLTTAHPLCPWNRRRGESNQIRRHPRPMSRISVQRCPPCSKYCSCFQTEFHSHLSKATATISGSHFSSLTRARVTNTVE